MNERDGASGGGYLTWDQNSRADARQVNEYVQHAGGARVRVNPAGTQAFGGGVDATTLVYQQVKGGRSDLRLYNLQTRVRSLPFPGVNTNLYELHPTISGHWILFGRRGAAGATTIVLANTATHTIRVVDRASPPGSVDPGQVNGDWATWDRCSSRCNVIRYRISTRSAAKVPNPLLRFQLAPSVDAAGDVFFNRSGGLAFTATWTGAASAVAEPSTSAAQAAAAIRPPTAGQGSGAGEARQRGQRVVSRR